MKTLNFNDFFLEVDFTAGKLCSLKLKNRERLAAASEIFALGIRNLNGEQLTLSPQNADKATETESGAIYNFSEYKLSVHISVDCENGEAAWRASVENGDPDILCEWIDFPKLTLPPLKDNGGSGEILIPFNEGAIVSDIKLKADGSFPYREPVYPSLGAYFVFPNMLCSQMTAYLFEDAGLYIGAHDKKRGIKGIDFYEIDGGIALQIRLFCGTNFGDGFSMDYPVIFSAANEKWESCAERYREWFESALPPKAKKIKDNPALPEWYHDSPVVISYPVRGNWDADEMFPNAFYPYTNALPFLKDVKEKLGGARLLTLLMHWEGTAPWAPPYVWPPYGDLSDFCEFRDEIHKNGDLLGVYCSGFGYTKKSNLVDDYEKTEEYETRDLARGMCANYGGKVEISKICTTQRTGYDICPASELGREILKEAYSPLFDAELDYAQILDQNHGGGQYFCHSAEHGHPVAPGAWMTENMQKMLSDWNNAAPNMLFGCESAAAEAFIGNLLFSDNRFELCYRIGRPVPLYAYIYHEYLRNFMGNQVSCPFDPDEETLCHRIAYSFAAGDALTLIFAPNGELMPHWGRPKHKNPPSKEKTLAFVKNLKEFYECEAKPYLLCGRMIPAPQVECGKITFTNVKTNTRSTLNKIQFSAWEAEDKSRVLILVNPESRTENCKVNGKEYEIPAQNAIMLKL